MSSKSDKEIRDHVLSVWKRMDESGPVPAICDGSGAVTIQNSGPRLEGVVAGGAVECPGCEACRGGMAPRAIETHCGGRGLAVGCPVCGKRFR